MPRRLWPCLFSFALLTACAAGTGEENDGVTKKSDARVEGGSDPDAADEDTAADDTGAADDVAFADTGTDTGSVDTGADTAPAETGPTSCAGEEPEPNDTPATARALGSITDCDSSGKTFSGVLHSSSDVDVVTFDGTDTFGCSVDPYVKATGPVNVCIAADCKSGTTDIQSCPKGTLTAGQCCGANEAQIQINCTGTSTDSAKITITVRGDGSAISCADYTLAYHY